MMNTLRVVFLFAIALAAGPVTSAAPAGEVWSGVYECSEMESDSGTSPAFTSSARMVIEGKAARMVRESPGIKETMSGRVAADGSLRLEGNGRRKGTSASRWRYRFDGRFEGDRFHARGMMFSAHLSTKLRDCTMSLARSRRAVTPSVTRATAPVTAAPAATAAPATPAAAEPPVPAAVPQSIQDELLRLPKPAGSEPVEKDLDFTERNDSAVVEGTVSLASPHRYFINAKKGQALAATLKSDDATRLDLYEPGSSVQMLSGGFVVQGPRIGGTPEGTQLSVELPGDGKYLLLVRSAKDESPYTLELTVSRGESSVGEGPWWEWKIVWIAAALVVVAIAVWRYVRRKRDRRLFRPD